MCQSEYLPKFIGRSKAIILLFLMRKESMTHEKIYGVKQRNSEPIVGTAVWERAKSNWLFRAGDCESGLQ